VGPGIAAWLNFANAAYVGKVEEVKEGSLTVRRMMEDGYDVLELPTPALISVVKEINEPRLPSLKGKLASKKAVIPKWDAADFRETASERGEGLPPHRFALYLRA
jgi:electron transfer flavoprotein beta subunit